MSEWLNVINNALVLAQKGSAEQALSSLGALLASREDDLLCRAIALDAEGKIFFFCKSRKWLWQPLTSRRLWPEGIMLPDKWTQ